MGLAEPCRNRNLVCSPVRQDRRSRSRSFGLITMAGTSYIDPIPPSPPDLFPIWVLNTYLRLDRLEYRVRNFLDRGDAQMKYSVAWTHPLPSPLQNKPGFPSVPVQQYKFPGVLHRAHRKNPKWLLVNWVVHPITLNWPFPLVLPYLAISNGKLKRGNCYSLEVEENKEREPHTNDTAGCEATLVG